MTSPHEIDCEFHCHTLSSHDGFTSYDDLFAECLKKNIRAVTITEHDVLNISEVDRNNFADAGIQLIPGCEMTSDTGAHIIGLFIKTAVSGKPAPEIIDHILRQDGLVYIPHPFKPDSGLLWTQPVEHKENQYVMDKAHFIELYNGGWDARSYQKQIRHLAENFNLRLVAGSDSHKVWQVGFFKNRLTVPEFPLDAGSLLNASIEFLTLTTSKMGAQTGGHNTNKRLIKNIQEKKLYQELVRRLPFGFKRKIKNISYRRQQKKYRQRNIQFTYTVIS